MTIRHMRIFLEVYRTENITQAAKLLHMTQPAVSRSILELEHYYGVCLFERINRRLYITECGRNFYNHALHILETFDLMEKELKDWDNIGSLRIGSSISLGNFLLPELVCAFKAEHPHVKIQTSIANSTTIQNALLNNQLDVALLEGDINNSSLHAEPFRQDHMILIVCPNHPLLEKSSVLLEDLTSYDLLTREPGSAGRTFLEHIFAIHQLPFIPIWESTSTQALIKAVSKGIGVSILPEMLVQQDILNGTVCTCPIQDEEMVRKNYLLWHKNKYLSRTMQDFIKLCHKT